MTVAARAASVACIAIAWLSAALLAPVDAWADDGCARPVDPAKAAGAPEEIYARAHAAYESGRYADAASLFRIIATSPNNGSMGLPAAMLSLDAVEKQMAEDKTCVGVLAKDVPVYRSLYCQGGLPAPTECVLLAKVARDIGRLDAEKLVERTGKERPTAARRLYREAGDAYVALWKEFSMQACQHGGGEPCERSEELLYNAARAYFASHAVPEAIAVASMLTDPQNGLSRTKLAVRSSAELGQLWVSIGEYARGVEVFERFAAQSPTDEGAPDALENATWVSAALGNAERAENNLATFGKLYGAKKRERVTSLVMYLADRLEARREWAALEKLLAAHRSVTDKSSSLTRFMARSMLGQALARQKKKARADEALRPIAAARPSDVVGPSNGMTGSDAIADIDLGRAATAVGAAKLYFADATRDDALKLVVKKNDPGSLSRKKTAIETAEHAYGAITDIAPVPPPDAMVAAAARVARMHAQLWAQVYLAMGEQAAGPYEATAIASHRVCVALASKLQHDADDARACSDWLGRHDPAHSPGMSELVPVAHWQGEPSLLAVPLAEDGDEALPNPKAEAP